ncbi:MAG: HAMP domain-containing histidine kinase [Oligoflexales bacterium]|nr:HAMP domain-containing histidine kinase [Oligoflexales bacterium]
MNFNSVSRLIQVVDHSDDKQEYGSSSYASLKNAVENFFRKPRVSNEEKEQFHSQLNDFIEQSASRRDELLREIIDTEKIQNRLIENNFKTQELFEQKNKLVRLLCHDLNNSITIIKSAAISSLEIADAEKSLKNWQRVMRAVNTQEEMVNHVKTLEAISSGKSVMKLEPVSISKILEDARFIFDEQLKNKGISFVTLVKGAQDFFVKADEVSLQNQVFNNILSNAIKFSEAGSRITVMAEKISQDQIRISICDEGIGIPEEIRKNLFSFTVHTSRTGTMGEKGTGFGMPLVKSFMDSYGGSIEIESKEKHADNKDHGTTFHLTFQECSGKNFMESA